MDKREIKGYLRKTFYFDVIKERTIYAYLCKEKMDRKQKKLLTDETRFKSYQSWKAYIVDRYKTYPKECLIEFSKAINLFLRESKKIDEYKKSIVIAYFSAAISALIVYFISEVVKNAVLLLVISILLSIIVFVMVIYVYQDFGEEDTYFYEDVKSIIDQIIEEKG